MNKGYWIALYKKIEDTNNLGDYAKKATETIIKHGGKPLVRGGRYDVLEGDDFPRTVIWEFPSYEAAKKSRKPNLLPTVSGPESPIFWLVFEMSRV